MTIVQLQQLLEIYKTGSVTQAAKNLFITQPSLSLTLKSLEEEIGYPIFLRTRKGLIPTTQGTAVIDHATRICESYQFLTTPSEQKSTTLRISSVSVTPVTKAFLQVVEENKGRRDITFSLTQENALDLLPNFMLEIGIMMVVTSAYLSVLDVAQSKGLEAEILATLPGAIRIGKGHPKYNTPHATVEDFEDDILLDGQNSSVSKALLSTGIARIKPNHSIFCTTAAARKALIDSGLAYEITIYFPGDEDNPNHRFIPMDSLNFHLVAITNPKHPPVRELDRFLNLLKENLANAGLSVQE
jgi:DNA-binding transcriptional LysR family regulator